MEDGFDDFEMRDWSNMYPEYDDMEYDSLNDELDVLNQQYLDMSRDPNISQDVNREISHRKKYINYLLSAKEVETSFIDSNDGKTVTIVRKDHRSLSAPEIEFTNTQVLPENAEAPAITDFIRREHNIDNFKFDFSSDRSIELRLRINLTKNNNIEFKPKTIRNEYGRPQIVLKRDSSGVLQYNTAKTAQNAVTQFKELINEAIEDQKDIESIRENMPMVVTDNQLEWEDDNGNINNNVIKGLSPKEISEIRGVLFPSDTIDLKSRIGPEGMLQKQRDHISETIGYTERELDRSEDLDAREALNDRIAGLKEARELIRRQKQLEETRVAQEEDISRLQKFKKWAKENIAGISALAISVAGIITTIAVGARKAILQGAQATSKFAKAVANLGKKLWPVLGPLLNVIAQAISWGAKGLSWLASNLWVLAIAFTWFIYDQYKQRRK